MAKPTEYKTVSIRLEMKHYRKLVKQAKAKCIPIATYVKMKTFGVDSELI